jgi:oxalate decarboxylase/phosphoglucose isomerase-like protein (cupin superfamily)
MYNLNPWWQTPVWEIDAFCDPEFNQILLDECYQAGQSIQRDQNPKNSMWDYAGPTLIELKDKIVQTVTQQVNASIQEARDLKLNYDCPMAWINVKEPGESIELHAHPDATMAVTYYLQAKDNSGDLVLVDTSNYENGRINLKHIKPVQGKLVFFPSYVLHYIEPNQSNDLRISLSTDVIQIVDRSAPNALVIKSWCNSLLKIRDWYV